MLRWLFWAMVLMVSCGGVRNIHLNERGDAGLRKNLVSEANTYLGTKYQYGGTGQRGFDCSGLVFLVFKSCGIGLPRSSASQASYGKSTSLAQAKVGDLIFFKQKGRVNHVAIISETKRDQIWIIHSTTSQGVIRENLLNSRYWSSRVYTTRDIVANRP